MSKMGRPKVDNPKAIKFSIRVDEATDNKLKQYAEQHNMTKGEAVRRAINQLLGIKK